MLKNFFFSTLIQNPLKSNVDYWLIIMKLPSDILMCVILNLKYPSAYTFCYRLLSTCKPMCLNIVLISTANIDV